MKRFAIVVLVVLTGCMQTITVPVGTVNRTMHTHKVWLTPDILLYKDDAGFGCGHIWRYQNGITTYRVDVVDWETDFKGSSRSPVDTTVTDFYEAERLVEQYCKP